MANKLILIVSLPPSRSESRLIATDPYAHVSTMRRCSESCGTGPYGGELSGPAQSAHSYSVCRNLSSESGAV